MKSYSKMMISCIVLSLSSVQAFMPATTVQHQHARRGGASMLSATTSQAQAAPPSALALLTFDLDDTLFPIGPVVEDANVAMVEAMRKLGYSRATNESILKHTSAIRKSIDSPITYTDLRMRAIQKEMEAETDSVHSSVVERCFDAWLNERQLSADRNLFSDALSMLQQVKEKHPDTCIGAITNGRGNPMFMASLEPFFDFCVSGEDAGVFPERKPGRGIYDASLSRFKQLHPDRTLDDENVWIHVGDCLGNDVGASADCGAYAVWKQSEHEGSSASRLDLANQPKWSTATKETLEKRQKLADKAKKKISAQITYLEDLPEAVDGVLNMIAKEMTQPAS